jgi:hypothetical protein
VNSVIGSAFGVDNHDPLTRDRGFESTSLQRRVYCQPDFRGRTRRAAVLSPSPRAATCGTFRFSPTQDPGCLPASALASPDPLTDRLGDRDCERIVRREGQHDWRRMNPNAGYGSAAERASMSGQPGISPASQRRTGPSFAFSATFEIPREDRIGRQGKCPPNSGRERASLIRAEISLADLNSEESGGLVMGGVACSPLPSEITSTPTMLDRSPLHRAEAKRIVCPKKPMTPTGGRHGGDYPALSDARVTFRKQTT